MLNFKPHPNLLPKGEGAFCIFKDSLKMARLLVDVVIPRHEKSRKIVGIIRYAPLQIGQFKTGNPGANKKAH
jgi:hypothetical protein